MKWLLIRAKKSKSEQTKRQNTPTSAGARAGVQDVLAVGIDPAAVAGPAAAMARSVVLAGTPRCARCQFVPRWCICAGFQAIECPLQIDVLMHHREMHRPTSTGRLINRVIPASRQHVYRQEKPLTRESVVARDRTLWILHPRGEPLPTDVPPAGLQVLLLDGSWREAAGMSQDIASWGRQIRLPESGPGRFQLRTHAHEGKYSTVESLIILLAALGLTRQATQLRLQFELHVYAGLRTRGVKAKALEFLATSPLPAAFPDLLLQLEQSRPLIRPSPGR